MKHVGRACGVGYLDNWLWVPKTHVNHEALKQALTYKLQNDYDEYDLELWRETPTHVLVPRMIWGEDMSKFSFPVVDCRPQSYEHVSFTSNIKLDHRVQDVGGIKQLLPTGETDQFLAVGSLLKTEGGTLCMACGRGKTCCALEYTALSQVPTLVLVDNSSLLEQWKREAGKLIGVPGGIGLIAKGTKDWKKGLVLGTYQTVASWADTMPEEVRRWFGNIICDEGHHVSAPVFSRAASLFYGKRLSLTATPNRKDGLSIVASLHIGPTVYKNLRPLMTPGFAFARVPYATNPKTPEILDRNGEIHITKLFSYYGTWRERMSSILDDCAALRAKGRKVLVLCNSVYEVVNMASMWNHGPQVQLIHEQPAAADEKELKRQNKAWIKAAIPFMTDAGIITYEVPPEVRQNFIANRKLNFAITKYGKEGLDDQELDTVLVSSLFTDENMLQQLFGRPTRPYPGKKHPLVIFYVDSLDITRAMSAKLMSHLRGWPVDEGGPYQFVYVNYRELPNSWTSLSQIA
jgi:superfamily II DNA or RNA helicase